MFDFDAKSEGVPFALQRLANPNEQRNYDTSGMGSGFNEHCAGSDIKCENEDEPIVLDIVDNEVYEAFPLEINFIKNLSADVFQQKLIIHFDISFNQHKVVWPRSNK